MLRWLAAVFFSHKLPFALLAMTWYFGYAVAAHSGSVLVALYYVVHILAGCGLIATVLFVLHPGPAGLAPHLAYANPHQLTQAVHRSIYLTVVGAPITGVALFFVPDLGWRPAGPPSFVWDHLYNDNLAHMLHSAQFYAVLLLGTLNLWVVRRRSH